MKKTALEFCRRGMAAGGLGPLVLAVLYLVLKRQGLVQTLTVDAVCRGIFSLWALAFVAGGMNVLYQIERLPLMAAVTIHGGVLYTISDSCAGITARADNRRYVTQCADFHYLSSGKAGERLTARSRVIKRGRSSCIVEVTTFDAAGRQLTLGVFTMFCLGEKKQGTPLQ